MAGKRGAGSELNHDNWDEEDEAEEAGEFKKASEDTMKGRVVKKAKRRNLTEDQKKNVFAGFGGFTSTNQSAAEAFSFLGTGKQDKDKEDKNKEDKNKEDKNKEDKNKEDKDKEDKDKEKDKVDKDKEDKDKEAKAPAGFVFGPTKADLKESKEDSTENGSDKDKEVEADGKEDLMAKFTTKTSGNWSCEICMISNSEDKSKCAACETPNPKATSVAKSDDLMAKFMTKSGGSWACQVCMISNPADKSNCVACESPNPAAAPAEKPDDLMSKFMSKSSDKWTCDICMISNTADKSKCAACETPKPGGGGEEAGEEAPKTTFNFGAGGGFKFAADDSATKSDTPLSGFTFGGSASAATEAAPASLGGFKFGASEPPAAAAPAGGFKFGVDATPTQSNTGFKFGGSSEAPPAAVANSLFQGPTGFKFSSTGKVSPDGQPEGPGAGTPRRAAGRRDYLGGLKALNTQVTNWIKSHVDENPLVDLSPVFRDYRKHLEELRAKHGIEINDDEEEKETAIEKVEVTPFSFGKSVPGGAAVGTNGSGFGFTAESGFGELYKMTDPKEGVAEEESGAVAEVEPVAEEDAFYSRKCKLFYKKEDAYVERGLGNVHLKRTEPGRVQVVVRAGTSLGNILLNVVVTDGVPVERVGKNNVMIICLPNPPIDPKAEPEPVTFLIRVKTAEDADELREKIVGQEKEVPE